MTERNGKSALIHSRRLAEAHAAIAIECMDEHITRATCNSRRLLAGLEKKYGRAISYPACLDCKQSA